MTELRYAWGPCPFPAGCDDPRPHVHYNPRPGAPIEVVYTDEDWGHAGLPVDGDAATVREARGLPVYRPTDPVAIDQAAYRAFAGRRGPNSE